MRQMKFKNFVLLIFAIIALIITFSALRIFTSVECDQAIIITDGFSEIPEKFKSTRNIYFLETHNTTDHYLTTRAACSIESAALMNPNTNIFVLFLSPLKYTRLKNWSQFRGILNYRNIHLKYFNTEDLTKDTIIEDWIHKGLLSSSWYQVAHSSDVLRYALLYKYLGIYLDLDVIVRISFDKINLQNFACFQDDREIVNNGIMKFSDDEGRILGKMLLNEVINHFDGFDWSMNGPKLLTRVLKNYCDVTDFLSTSKCGNFTILPQELCYPIPLENYEEYFTEHGSMESIEDSYFAHFRNSNSEGRKLKKQSHTAFNQLAPKYCPHVYNTNILI